MDIKFMERALALARESATFDEVPVGAVIVKNGEIVAESGNRKEQDCCAVSHAEILAMRLACEKLGNWWLEDCELYVTLEPCAMCAGAMINSRIKSVYFGARDPKTGACGSKINVLERDLFNHNIAVQGGIMETECGAALSEFFKKKRMEKGER